MNRKACAGSIRAEGYRMLRIPGTSGFVRISLRDTVKLSEAAVSAVIRMSGRYAVLDEAGAQIRTESGRELMKRFDDRTRRRIMAVTKSSDSL